MDWPRVKINDNMAGKKPRETAIIARFGAMRTRVTERNLCCGSGLTMKNKRAARLDLRL